MAQVRILAAKHVRQALDMPACIRLQEQAFRWLAEGQAFTSDNAWLRMPMFGGWLKLLAGCVVPQAVAAVKSLARNPRLPSGHNLSGLMLLYDARHNTLLSIMDAVYITALRTGAGGGLAARYLARPESESVGILGSGVQARMNLEACALELKGLKRVRVYSRSEENRRKFAVEMAAKTGLAIEPVAEPAAAVQDADLVITATNSPAPMLQRQWLAPGTCVLLMGIKSEVYPDCFPGTKIVLDDREIACADGKVAAALQAGVLRREELHADLAEVVTGRKPGRTSPQEITFFDSSGVAIQDLVCAYHSYQQAEALGLGTLVEIGGDEEEA